MLSTINIISLDQGKLYGDPVAVEDLPVPPEMPRASLFRRMVSKLLLRKRKDPAEAGPSTGQARLPETRAVTG